MKTLTILTLVAALAASAAAAQTVNSDNAEVGKLPPNWTGTKTAKVGVWTKADSVTLFDDFTFASK